MPLFEVERVAIEVVSAIACFMLVRFMIKPFKLTGESRYLGLPIGFGILGASYAFSAFSYSSYFDFSETGWVQLFVRGFAFFVLAITYYFSKSQKAVGIMWKIILGALALFLVLLVLFLIIVAPGISLVEYRFYYIVARLFGLFCLGYISIHALKSHVKQPDLITLASPIGYILLSIDQYSSLIWVVDRSYSALFGGLTFRLASFVIFLYLSYKALYSKHYEGIDEENSTQR